MKRKLVCSKCSTKHYIYGDTPALSFHPRLMLCWECDENLQKDLNRETEIAAQIAVLQEQRGI